MAYTRVGGKVHQGDDGYQQYLQDNNQRAFRTIRAVTGAFALAFALGGPIVMLTSAVTQLSTQRSNMHALHDWSPTVWDRQERVIVMILEHTGPLPHIDVLQNSWQNASSDISRIGITLEIVEALKNDIHEPDLASTNEMIVYLTLSAEIAELSAMSRILERDLQRQIRDFEATSESLAGTIVLGLGIVSTPDPHWIGA